MKAKHLFLSKTFWLNVLGLVLTVSDVLPPKWAAPIIAIANIANRLLTNQPATLL